MIPSAPVVRLAVRLLGVVPAAPVRWLARAIGTVAFSLARDRRATLLENQRFIARDASPAVQRRQARRTMTNMLDAAVDLFHLPTMQPAEVEALIGVEGREHLDAALSLEKGVVVATAHLGPYELGGAWLALAGYPVHGMAEDLDPETNAALALYRQATGMKVISRNGGLRASIRILREKEILLLVADRVVGHGSDGLPVPFGDGVRALPTGPAALSLATGAPIVTGHIARNRGRGPRYLVRLEAPIIATSTGDAAHDREAITRLVAERLSAAVQAHPDQWFVFQPQWLPRDAPSRD